ncbi:hypothetical protein IWQ62_000157 [Dispira parvispora]|uniref:Chitin-binding type-2 domain-containing protein n=1 Tax=Dispira parvispora TaxID=1520584 RepID=A0A9W8E5B5_9FUNG|nr:hypothetical protein IWQ62_000157 [Dispira parvispora]
MNYLSTLSLFVVAMLASTMTVQAIPRPGDAPNKAADPKPNGGDHGKSGGASEPWYADYFNKCVDGTMRCDHKDAHHFYVCDHSKPVNFQCGPGTACHQKGEYIICDYA